MNIEQRREDVEQLNDVITAAKACLQRGEPIEKILLVVYQAGLTAGLRQATVLSATPAWGRA